MPLALTGMATLEIHALNPANLRACLTSNFTQDAQPGVGA
jgi:hypothetical protein